MNVRPITEDEIATYRRDGVAKLPGYVDPAGVEVLLRAIDDQLARRGPWYSERVYKQDRCFALGQPALRDYVLDPVMGENAARAMGSSVANFYFDHVFHFDPDTPIAAHYWHQDQPFWPVEGDHLVSFWLSLTSCTPESSALKFVPGSHRGERLYRPHGFDGQPLLGDLGERSAQAVDVADRWHDGPPPAFHEDAAAHGIVEWSYEPGDAVMFDARTLHSSGGNTSTTSRRVAYSIRCTGDDARFMLRRDAFQDPALLPDDDEPFVVGEPLASRKWPRVHPA